MPPSKKDWVLTRASFDQLLFFLDQDVHRAAEKYEDLRQMLITFFEMRGMDGSDDLADEAINRVTRRLSEGEEIFTSNPNNYFYSVARNIWREQIAAPKVISGSLEDVPVTNARTEDHLRQAAELELRLDQETRLSCLEHCLAELPTESRDLLTSYYRGERDIKIRHRKELAALHGIELNALRIRVCRLRDKLEQCVKNRLRSANEEKAI